MQNNSEGSVHEDTKVITKMNDRLKGTVSTGFKQFSSFKNLVVFHTFSMIFDVLNFVNKGQSLEMS